MIKRSKEILAEANRAATEANAATARAKANATRMRLRAMGKDAKAGGKSENARPPGERNRGGGESGGRERGASCPTPNSFVPGTQVVMADGSHKPIESVHLGDKVKATDPSTGKVTAQLVVATFVHTDEPTQTVLAVRGSDASMSTVQGTDWHPIWDEDQHAWVPIAELPVGDHLDSLDGSHPVVVSVTRINQEVPVHNLTIDALHTYTVLTGSTTVLVHNCGGADNVASGARQKEFYSRAQRYGKGGVRELSDGRVRMYGNVTPARNPGQMVGRRMVYEWNQNTNATRIWHETLDNAGNIRIVRPGVKGTNGLKKHYMFDSAGNFVGTF